MASVTSVTKTDSLATSARYLRRRDAARPVHATPATSPRVWALMGHKAGDNAQVLALTEALNWPFEIKRFAYKKWEAVPNFTLGVTLAGIDKDASSPLVAPWPDLVITSGRRNEPIARWIQQQAAAQGQRVRLIHLGRPWSKIERFDLIVTTPQYRLPVRPNVLHNKTPLHRVNKDRLREEAGKWRDQFAHLPKPHVAVIIGGSSGPYSFDHAAAERLARQASAFAAEIGGSLLVTTSARTPAATIDTFCEHVTVPAFVYRWRKDATDNPYFGLLAVADRLIVTGDSMSMLAEACATKKPVYIFDLGEGRNAMRPETRDAADREYERTSWYGPELARLRAYLYRQMMTFGPQRLSRDIRIIHKYLTDTGRAAWLGDALPSETPLPTLDCLARAVARTKALFDFAPARATSTEANPSLVLARRTA